jgi:hypothetical protein
MMQRGFASRFNGLVCRKISILLLYCVEAGRVKRISTKLTAIKGSPILSLYIFRTVVCFRVEWPLVKEHEARHVKGNTDMTQRDELTSTKKGQIMI